MALQFVAGPSGCGKSYFVYNYIIEQALKRPKDRFFVIVPEQFNMQTQKELTRMHPNHALLNIDVLSFHRLAYRVFEETGVDQAPVLEDMGKILVLQRILSENRDALSVLGGMLGKSGAAEKVNSQLSELMQYNIGSEKLAAAMEGAPELLKRKMADLSLIMGKFQTYIESRYLVAEEVPVVLSGVVEQCRALQNAVVVFDGFTGFVPTQYMVIEKLLGMCREVIVTATTDKKAGLRKKSSPSNLFHMTHEMADRLLELADKTGTPVREDIWLSSGPKSRFGNRGALAFLEQKLFRYEKGMYEEPQDAIHIAAFPRAADEVQAAAEIIAKLVRTKGYRYRDFAFISGSMEDYGETAERIFKENGIPCFLDEKHGVASNPAVEFIRSAVEMAVDNLSYRSVFRFLKTGMGVLTQEEVCRMENYVLAFGVNGKKGYENAWTRTGKTIRTEDLEELNEIRERFYQSVSAFTGDFRKRGASVEERTKALYFLAAESALQEKCAALEQLFTQRGEAAKAKEYAQIYRLIMDFLEKLTDIMGEEKVSLEVYRQLLEAGFREMRIGVIPSGQDQVLIGDMERTRLKSIRVMFFAGLNEGVVPKPADRAAILSQADRKALEKESLELAPDAREEVYRQRLYMYLNLTKPAEQLYLSFCRTNGAGETMEPSYLIGTLRELFPKQEEETDAARWAETVCGRRERLLEGFGQIREKIPDNAFLELMAACRKKDDAFLKLLVSGAMAQRPETNIGRKAAQRLYQKHLRYSASRLEVYGSCAFRHFLNYGLHLQEREKFEFSSMDIGNLLHDAIRFFCEAQKKEGWREQSREAVEQMADNAFMQAYAASAQAQLSESRFFDMKKLGMTNRMTALAVYEQIRRGDFRPAMMEESFLVEGTEGRIDRADVYRGADADYVRVIDYKSGARDIDLMQLYYGTQLQLPLYMTAACELTGSRRGRLALPAGMYYYGMTDPMLEVNDLQQIVPKESFLKAVQLKGISLAEPEVLQQMDHALQPAAASDVVPVRFLKGMDEEGRIQISKQSRTVSGEDFAYLQRYTRHLLKKMRREIEEGRAVINPKMIGKDDSCTYCPYCSVCRFDAQLPGYRKLQCGRQSDEEALAAMLKELNEKGGTDGN